jgi:hypothetical protein
MSRRRLQRLALAWAVTLQDMDLADVESADLVPADLAAADVEAAHLTSAGSEIPPQSPQAPAPQPDNSQPDKSVGDLRFRALLSDDDWHALPLAVRRRFSKRLAGGCTAIYAGEVLETHMSRLGWCLAQAARLLGGPLPTSRDMNMPSVVTVTEDMATGGQIWTRLYARRQGFPQIVHSSKRFAGSTGIEEYLGRGFGIALRIGVCRRALVFRSDSYFLQIFGRRLRVPTWLSPGTMTVGHAERGDGRFAFTLELTHPRFGLLIRQSAAFREASP